MNVYTCNTFTGYYPVGTAATVIAGKDFVARNRLNKFLKKVGLPGDAKTKDMKFLVAIKDPFFSEPKETVRILSDGNY
jgi:hypothetical protein